MSIDTKRSSTKNNNPNQNYIHFINKNKALMYVFNKNSYSEIYK